MMKIMIYVFGMCENIINKIKHQNKKEGRKMERWLENFCEINDKLRKSIRQRQRKQIVNAKRSIYYCHQRHEFVEAKQGIEGRVNQQMEVDEQGVCLGIKEIRFCEKRDNQQQNVVQVEKKQYFISSQVRESSSMNTTSLNQYSFQEYFVQCNEVMNPKTSQKQKKKRLKMLTSFLSQTLSILSKNKGKNQQNAFFEQFLLFLITTINKGHSQITHQSLRFFEEFCMKSSETCIILENSQKKIEIGTGLCALLQEQCSLCVKMGLILLTQILHKSKFHVQNPKFLELISISGSLVQLKICLLHRICNEKDSENIQIALQSFSILSHYVCDSGNGKLTETLEHLSNFIQIKKWKQSQKILFCVFQMMKTLGNKVGPIGYHHFLTMVYHTLQSQYCQKLKVLSLQTLYTLFLYSSLPKYFLEIGQKQFPKMLYLLQTHENNQLLDSLCYVLMAILAKCPSDSILCEKIKNSLEFAFKNQKISQTTQQKLQSWNNLTTPNY